MNIEEAKSVRIVDFLARLGHHAQYVKSEQYWYLSPLRKEVSPSFKVNDREMNGTTLVKLSAVTWWNWEGTFAEWEA